MSEKRKVLSVVRAATGEFVSIGEAELDHAMKHFSFPKVKVLETVELVLIDPTEVYTEELSDGTKTYHHFYRLESGKYLLVVTRVMDGITCFSSMYATGTNIKKAHKGLKKIKL